MGADIHSEYSMSEKSINARFVRVFCLIAISGAVVDGNPYLRAREESIATALTARATEVAPMTSIPNNQGTVWYVDTAHGADTNDGRTTATAFKTITSISNHSGRDNSRLRSGDVIVVRAGIYTETVRMQMPGHAGGPTASGTPYGAQMEIAAHPGHESEMLVPSGRVPLPIITGLASPG